MEVPFKLLLQYWRSETVSLISGRLISRPSNATFGGPSEIHFPGGRFRPETERAAGPDCPYPLLGRDLLQKLQATITFRGSGQPGGEGPAEAKPGVQLEVTVPISEEYLLAALLEVLLQYVDDLLVAATSPKECETATKDLLRELEEKGYRVSAKKAQIARQTVSYLGYNLQGGQRMLSSQRIQAVMQIPEPTNKRQSLQALQNIRREVRALQQERYPKEQGAEAPEPGQWVWILNHRRGSLEPRWIGPYQVLLSTPSAVRVAEKPYWIHLAHIKPAPTPDKSEKWSVQPVSGEPLRVKFFKS
ncbi:uncharacterized protein LOC128625757 [Artibeus jamaicensis]|uniref:uncharacterized protein LOC128625757 n=1 Tax=Artibeus jamaicensis TaxID=9417 RepID=UPI00235A753D|nr:uncharacterized protein LOC128625757 [Artibeus jamaicensis]